MKPLIRGFIDMQNIDWHNTDEGKPSFTLRNVRQFPGIFGGIVLNATWEEMQRQAGDDVLHTDRIDDALNRVRAYNAAHPTAPLGVKLRIYGGNHAPHWAKAINGGPITIKRNPQGCSSDCAIRIGKVWDPQYIDAWRAFQALVAQRYDSEPLIRSVAITSCAMETDEPFVMPVQQKVPPGYTDAAGKACLRGAVDDYAAWRRTAIDFTINSFLQIQKGGSDPEFSLFIINACRARLGARCELGNHGFGAGMVNPNLGIVQAIAARRGPIHFQTVGPKKSVFVSWPATVRAAWHYNATALELWPDQKYGGFTNLSVGEMRRLLASFNRPRN